MKLINKIFSKLVIAFAMLIAVSGCNKILEEEPFTVFTVEYLKTPQGIQDAVNAAYSSLRYHYGPLGACLVNDGGTDEWTYGDQPRIGNGADMLQLTSYKITSANGAVGNPWFNTFPWINLCNAIVAFAPDISMSENAKKVILGEARFIRALNYMILVHQFGGVPLDLGSGVLKFNQKPFTGFNRENPTQLLVDNYQSIIDDLMFASQNLPVQRPATAFKLSQAAAKHLLAKAYLHRGYSSAAQGSDFQNAYTTAIDLINNKATYGLDLLPNFRDVHKEGNDYNKEIIFSVERIPLNSSANELQNPDGFEDKANMAVNIFNCDYTQPNFPNTNFKCVPNRVFAYGRPLRQFSPTKWTTEICFADKVNDSRYHSTFRTVWQAATLDAPGSAGYNTYVNNLASIGLTIGDTAIYLADTDAQAVAKKAEGKKYFILGPSERYTNQLFTWNVYPTLQKHHQANRAGFNNTSGRPYMVARFAETYLIAAEAAMKLGNNTEAANLINVLKLRAVYRPGLSSGDITARYDNIKVAAGNITLDFILDERTRELCGEGHRWVDLAIRNKLMDRLPGKNPDVTDLKEFHRLRPIPQGQLDAISTPNPNQFQNPGY
jgi:hypothetical protein